MLKYVRVWLSEKPTDCLNISNISLWFIYLLIMWEYAENIAKTIREALSSF